MIFEEMRERSEHASGGLRLVYPVLQICSTAGSDHRFSTYIYWLSGFGLISDGVHGWGSIIYITCKMEIEPMHLSVEDAVSRQPFMHFFYLIFISCDSCIYAYMWSVIFQVCMQFCLCLVFTITWFVLQYIIIKHFKWKINELCLVFKPNVM